MNAETNVYNKYKFSHFILLYFLVLVTLHILFCSYKVLTYIWKTNNTFCKIVKLKVCHVFYENGFPHKNVIHSLCHKKKKEKEIPSNTRFLIIGKVKLSTI